MKVTLRHWDEDMRRLGSQSLRKICELNVADLGPGMVRECAQLLRSPDAIDVHGGLLALSELACAFENCGIKENRRQVSVLPRGPLCFRPTSY